jgi:Putative Flp pilus-assembly TadE/G-like
LTSFGKTEKILMRGVSAMKNHATSKLGHLTKSDEGQALVLTALALVVLMLMAGLGVDVGYLRYEKQQMQKAADAGAVGGAAALGYAGDWNDAAVADVNANGYTVVNGNGVTINVYNPPIDPPFNTVGNKDQYVEVVVSHPQPTFFMKVGGFYSVPVKARAVAGLIPSSGCIYVLDPSDQDTLVVSGSGEINSSCGVYVDSSNPKGLDVTGSGCITASNGNINIVGGYSAASGGCPSGGISPYPPTEIQSFKDPLAWVQPPSELSCPHTPAVIPSECTYSASGGLNCSKHPTTNIQPDTYCGGITISAAAGSATFAPGIYSLRGGGLTASGGVSIYGTGVTFYNTTNAADNPQYNPIVVSGGSTTSLIAPTTGPLAGILFFQDRNLPSKYTGKSGNQNTVSGGSGAYFQGALYFPTTPLTYSGGGSTTSPYTIIDAYVLTISGSSQFNDQYAAGGGSPIHSPSLVE